MKIDLFYKLLSSFLIISLSSNAQIQWKSLEPGLWFANPPLPTKSSHGDSKVSILKIDPSKFNFRLVLATENDLKKKPLDGWCKEKNLLAGINAGMFHGQTQHPGWKGLVNGGYTRNFTHIQYPEFTEDQDFIVFNPKNSKLPPIQILDKTCQDARGIMDQYHSVVQGIRIIDCHQKVIWERNERKFSMCILCTDTEGNCLFVHCRSPYQVHDFMSQLLQLVPTINRAIYLEGGLLSSFYIHTKAKKISLMGSYQTRYRENDTNQKFGNIPNVIGIQRK